MLLFFDHDAFTGRYTMIRAQRQRIAFRHMHNQEKIKRADVYPGQAQLRFSLLEQRIARKNNRRGVSFLQLKFLSHTREHLPVYPFFVNFYVLDI